MSTTQTMPDLGDGATATGDLVRWVHAQPAEAQEAAADTLLAAAIAQAAQHKSASGNGCVLLCGLLTQCARSTTSPTLRQWARSAAVGERLLSFYLQWNETDQSRSMKLVLDVLVLVMAADADGDSSEDQERRAERERLAAVVLDSLVAVVSGSTTRPMAKSAVKMLDHMLGKGVFGLPTVAAAYNRARATEFATAGEDVAVWRSLMGDLFEWMRLGHVAAPAGHLVVLLYRLLVEEHRGSAAFTPRVWHGWLVDAVLADETLLAPFQNYIFYHLFKTQRAAGLDYLEAAVGSSSEGFGCGGGGGSAAGGDDVDTRTLLELTILKVGKKVGVVEEPGSGGGGSKKPTRAVVMDMTVLRRVISHPTPDIRSLALNLLVTTASTTRPFPAESFAMLQRHLAAFFADLDARFRNDVVVLAKDMYHRLRAAMLVLHKSVDKQTAAGVAPPATVDAPPSALATTLAQHKAFLVWYLDFLRAELVPTASYQRHVTALKVLVYVVRMETAADKPWGARDDELFFAAFNQTWARALLDLLMDRFDEVRAFAAQALDLFFGDVRFRRFVPHHHGPLQGPATPVLREFLARAEELATRTGRADHGDGVGRTAELLYKHSPSANQRLSLLVNLVIEVDKRILLAESDLGRAVVEAPVHGSFSALSQVWQSVAEEHYSPDEREQLAALCGTIVSCCRRVWACVRAILCDDSPEGHLPQDLEETEGLGTKELLSYSFRAVNDASALMRAMVVAGRPGGREAAGLRPSAELLRDIGDLAFEQLASLRHRGALGTVAVTFVACCQLVGAQATTTAEGEGTLLDRWHRDTLACIATTASTTRRSAGIPAMAIGLLSADAARPSFDDVFDELVRIAAAAPAASGGTPDSGASEGHLARVHAHNCLREIFRSAIVTGLGNKAERRLSEALELAATSLKSEV